MKSTAQSGRMAVHMARSTAETFKRPIMVLVTVVAWGMSAWMFMATHALDAEHERLAQEKAKTDAQKEHRVLEARHEAIIPSKPPTFVIDQIAVLERIADRAGLSPDHAEAQPVAQTVAAEDAIRLTYALIGSYPAIKTFVFEAQRKVPGLALVSLNLRRQTIGESVLQAEATFTLYLRMK